VEGRPAGSCRLNTVEPEVGEIERIDKGVYCANRVLLVDPIVQALGQKVSTGFDQLPRRTAS